MSRRKPHLGFALLVLTVCALGFPLRAAAFTGENSDDHSFTLQVPHLSLSSDFLPAAQASELPEAEGPLLAQAPPGGGAPAPQPQGETFFGRPPMRRGSWEVGILLGRMVPGPGGPDLSHITPDKKFPKGAVRGYWAFPRIGYTFADMPLYPGSFTLYLEPAIAYITTPSHVYMLGVSLFLRHSILVWGPLTPYIEAGAGLMNTNLRNQVLGDSIQFMLMPGGGVRVNLFERFSFDVGYRYQHISDAGLTERNRGINSHLPYIGFTHFF